MMNYRGRTLFTILLFFLSIVSIKAERIDGPANLRAEPKGKVLFSLFDNVEVECTEAKDGWYKVAFIAVDELDAEDRKLLYRKGDTIYDYNKKALGVALVNINDSLAMFYDEMPAENGLDRFEASFFASTFHSNIKPESIVENKLVEVINQNIDHLNLQVFENHLKDFNYGYNHESLADPEYNEYWLHANYIDDISPIDRIRLLFKDDSLIAIAFSRDLDLIYPIVDLQRGRRLMILVDLPKKERELLIKANIDIYNHMD